MIIEAYPSKNDYKELSAEKPEFDYKRLEIVKLTCNWGQTFILEVLLMVKNIFWSTLRCRTFFFGLWSTIILTTHQGIYFYLYFYIYLYLFKICYTFVTENILGTI